MPDALSRRTSLQAAAAPRPPAVLEPFDYDGVRLRSSRWQARMLAARHFYLAVSNDDILHGYRAAALRDKALALVSDWAKALPARGAPRMRLHSCHKLLCGLVDLHLDLNHASAAALIERTLAHVMATFDQRRIPATRDQINGQPHAWCTFAKNLYRAAELTGAASHRAFAASLHYTPYWSKFLRSSRPNDAHRVHAGSHANTFSSAARARQATRAPDLLQVTRNAFDYLRATQCHATGGFGPMERFVPPDGTLGRSLQARPNTFEAVCGSWAGCKLSRYLARCTGQARYLDRAERLFYNGVGAALPITADGKHFYCAGYRLHGGTKFYKVSRWSCCSGTYPQNVAGDHNLVYCRHANSLYVAL